MLSLLHRFRCRRDFLQYTTPSEGRVGKERDFPGSAKMLEGMKKYTDIPVPALVIFAIPHAQAKWVDDSKDPKVREAAKAYSGAQLVLTTRQAKVFEDGIPTAHVVRLRGADHYVYLSNEADVLREMKSFLSTFVATPIADKWNPAQETKIASNSAKARARRYLFIGRTGPETAYSNV